MENWKRIVLRAAGFGAGAALTAAIIIGLLVWWNGRPAKPKPMNTRAITATFAGMEAGTRGEVFYLTVTYGLRNNTVRDYQLPSVGQFMIVNPENKGLDTVDGVKWDSTDIIPPGQTVNMKFEIPYQLSDYDLSSADLASTGKGDSAPSDKFVAFANKRIKGTNGFRFFDNTQRYEIDFPKLPPVD